MKPAPFRYHAPRTLEEALALKAGHGDEAHFLAGGQSLVPAMNFRVAQPEVLIDLNPLQRLSYIRRDGDGTLRLGALARHRMLERAPLVAAHQPLVHEAMPHVAHYQIRTRGTLGGNLAHADPASELPALMLALGATLEARSVRGTRWIEAADFFTGPLATVLAEDEMLTEVTLPPLPPRTGCAFLELARRRGDYAMMGVAAVLSLDEAGKCAELRLAYLSAGPTPMPAPQAAALLRGEQPAGAAIEAVAARAGQEIDPAGSIHASSAYQRHLAVVLTGRALATAAERAAA